MKIYIAGKITGRENHKADFKAAEEKLSEQGVMEECSIFCQMLLND